jgi:nitronate monooxygenase
MTIEELKSRTALPVFAAPMFLVSGTKLVIECCRNGIVGSFPSLNGRTSKDFEDMLIEISTSLREWENESGKKASPYAVNIIVNKTNPRVLPDLQLCVKYKVPIVITSLGAVKEVVDAVHSYGGLVFHDIIKKRHAEKAAESGVDGIICVTAGAGGHAGIANPFALVAEIRSFFKGAILLAGSINTGSDILAAKIMGADFAYMGTRFIATRESLASEEYKKMITESAIEDVIYTDSISGVNANFLKKSIEKAGVDPTKPKGSEDFSDLHAGSAAWKDIWSAGQGVTGIKDIPSVSEMVARLQKEYQEKVNSISRKD